MKNHLSYYKILACLFLLCMNLVSFCQIELPYKIRLASYYDGLGGYLKQVSQEDKIEIARFTIDSCTFEYHAEKSAYISTKLYHSNKMYTRDSVLLYKLQQKKISKSINKEFISYLIQTIDTTRYKKTYSSPPTVDASWGIFGARKYTYWVIKSYSKELFGFDNKKFQRQCEKKKTNYDNVFGNDCTDSLINACIEQHDDNNELYISTHSEYFCVDLFFSDRFIRLSQKYPGQLNVTWEMFDNTNPFRFYFKNPALNDIISQMTPQGFLYNKHLNEYKSAIYKLYFIRQ